MTLSLQMDRASLFCIINNPDVVRRAKGGSRNAARLPFFALLASVLLLLAGCPGGGTTIPVPPPAAKDTTPPEIKSTVPGQNDYGVLAGGTILSATFTEPIDCALVSSATFTIEDSTYQRTVPGTLSCSGSTLTYTLDRPLPAANGYRVVITTDIADLAGNHMTIPFTWFFQTAIINSNLFFDAVSYGTFLYSRPPAPPALYLAKAVAVGDVNGDHLNDVVLTTNNNQYEPNEYRMFVLLQNPTTHDLDWPASYVAGNGYCVDIRDLNNDGKNDVVVTAWDGIGVFLQDSTGGLASMVTYSSSVPGGGKNTYLARIGDFNHDGKMDVAAIDDNSYLYGLNIFHQDNMGTLNSAVAYTLDPAYYKDLDIGDLNHDGLTDVAMMTQSGAGYSVEVLLQNNGGALDAPALYGQAQLTGGDGLAIGDVNGDGLNDLVTTNGTTNRIDVLIQNGNGSFEGPFSYAAARVSPTAVEIADVNNDGRNDVIVVHNQWSGLGVHLQAADGTLLPAERYGIPYASYMPHALTVGDINGDGKNDVVIADHNSGLVILYHQ